MKLDQVLHGDGALLYMERYVDEGTRTYSRFATISEAGARYQPRSDQRAFELVTVFAPRSAVSVFQAAPQNDLMAFYVGRDEVRFPVHPETWRSAEVDRIAELHLLRQGAPIEVAPTASTRTVFTMNALSGVPAHFIKLHYPRRISRFNRRLRRKNIRNSVLVTADLEQLGYERFAYLPDSLGVTFGHAANPWGFLVREIEPRPFRPGRFLIPFFSLYGGDLHDPESLPLLVQLIGRLGADPVPFVVGEIMLPVLECWCRAVRERGILLECHAQNILLEVDTELRPRRIVHRDFDVWIDAEARRQAGLESPFFGSDIGTDTAYAREEHYSLVYDHFIGRELFDYLARVMERYFSADVRGIRKQVREAFHRGFPGSARCFPDGTTYYFSDELLPGNEFRLVDTKQKPEWR